MRILPTSLTLVGFTAIAVLAGCSSTPAATPGTGGSGNAAAGSSPGTGGKPAGTGTSTGGTATSSGGTGTSTGGSGTSTGGSGTSTGGTATGSGGTATGSGGTATGSGGTATGSGGTATGSGGGNTAGAANPNGPDQMGKTNAKPGDTASTKFDYLKMGEIRLINNNWGSVELKCTAPMSVFVAADKSFGWNFDRGACNDGGAKPDFPQLEFGIHPFGVGSSLATSPNFSSTTLLPLQIRDITSASVTLTDLNITFDPGKEGKWDLTFEFWTSTNDPGKPDAGVYSELMTFWGWEANRWPEPPDGSGPLVRNCNPMPCKAKAGDPVTAGKNYKLEVQDDQWADNKWRYFQFRDTAGPSKTPGTFTVDVKKLIDYLVNTMGYSKDLWVSRLEVGAEIGDNNKGKVTMKNVEFEVNGQKRSPVFSQ